MAALTAPALRESCYPEQRVSIHQVLVQFLQFLRISTLAPLASCICCPSLPLQVPEGYAHPAAPIRLAGNVTTGFGRGSKQLGVPTANLPPGPLAAQLAGLSTGVYFG